MSQNEFEAFRERLVRGGCHPVAQAMFAYYFARFRAGDTGEVPEAEIEPPAVAQLVSYESLPAVAGETRGRVAMVKLNGGLGTSMGLTKAKSLLEVKPGLTFLDVIAQQALVAAVPLVLMNSYNTHEDSMALLAGRYPELAGRGLLRAFVQNRFPRIELADGGVRPLSLAEDEANWNPPGHGDLYPSVLITGILDELLERGIEVAFVSNSDNLGAVMDDRIAAHMLARGEELPFLMEVRVRGEMDRKGGHLARRRTDRQLVLREVAQCPAAEMDCFQDIQRYRYFNTNNLWVNLRSLKRALAATADGFLPLPMIRNAKTVDGRKVVQLETAMGAAIELFPGAAALVVPRSRYAPVKTVNHLLAIRSDAYALDPASRQLVLTGGRTDPPVITLDPELYRTVPQLDVAFPRGIPSLAKCTSLTIRRQAVFPPDARFEGQVVID